MNFDSKLHRPSRRRRLLLPALAALAFVVGQHAVADTPPAPAMTRIVGPMQSPLPQSTEGSDEFIVMLCRHGIEPGRAKQEVPQDLPLVCLVTQADAAELQMGPARFQELLDKAVNSGQLSVLLLRPQ
jgi:hypothetical protein